jgi:hypothetical protein
VPLHWVRSKTALYRVACTETPETSVAAVVDFYGPVDYGKPRMAAEFIFSARATWTPPGW